MTDRNSMNRRGPSDLGDGAKWLNVSGETIPAYGVVQFKANYAAGYNQASKPDGEGGLYFANGGVDVLNTKHGESLIWKGARLVLLEGSPPVGTVVGPTDGSWAMSEDGVGFVVMHQAIGGIGSVAQVGGGGGGAFDIEFTVISMDCYSTPWILTVEVTWFSGGCTASIPGADQYTGYVEVENRCNIANHFTAENIVGLTGTATYRYPRTGTCTPAWRLDDICSVGECQT